MMWGGIIKNLDRYVTKHIKRKNEIENNLSPQYQTCRPTITTISKLHVENRGADFAENSFFVIMKIS